MSDYGIEYDNNKRMKTLDERGVDFADALEVFSGDVLSRIDDRYDYGEARVITIGKLGSDFVVIVWTERGSNRRIISMRKANEREKAFYRQHMA